MRYSRMLDVVLSNRFKKDLKLAAKRGLDLDALNAIVDQLAAGQPLPLTYGNAVWLLRAGKAHAAQSAAAQLGLHIPPAQ